MSNQVKCGKCGKEFTPLKRSDGSIVCPGCRTPVKPEVSVAVGNASANANKSAMPTPQIAEAAQSANLKPGQVVKGFEIIRKIGSGGMGTVYLAMQKSMQREVALKILNPNITKDEASVNQFLKEALNSGKLQHPNIVSAIDAGQFEEGYFLAMQYINGEALDTTLEKNGPIPPIRVMEIAIQVAEALDYVWTKFKMFHRDIKPGNIMIDEDGKPMLMDMGIAQNISENGSDTSIEGSPYYMSPEQIRGEQLSWTTDQYSLGASLYQLISGVTPYDAPSIEEILRLHCSSQLLPFAKRDSKVEIPDYLFDLIKKMMSKRAKDRYETWLEFIKAAREVLGKLKADEAKKNEPVPEKTEAEIKAEEALKKRKRNRLIGICAAAAVVILIAVGAGSLLFYNIAHAKQLSGKLDEEYKNFTGNPANSAVLEELLTKSRKAATALGVPAEIRDDLAGKVETYQKNMDAVNRSNQEFDKSAETFKTDSAEIQKIIDEQTMASSPDSAEIERASQLLANNESEISARNPKTADRIKALQEATQKIAEMHQGLDKCREHLREVQLKRSKEEAARRKEEAENIRINAEREARAEVERQARETKEREEREAREKEEQTAAAYEKQFLDKMNKAATETSAKIYEALIVSDFNGAAAVKFPQDALDMQASTQKQTDMRDFLVNQFNLCHMLLESAAELWNYINSQEGLASIRGTKLTNPINRKPDELVRIKNGTVELKSGMKLPFTDLYIKDRNKIVDSAGVAYARTHNKVDIRGEFCICAGLFVKAKKLVNANFAAMIPAFSKVYILTLYKNAVLKKNVKAQDRIRRDYMNYVKAMEWDDVFEDSSSSDEDYY